jgi:YidC/Oxa1 family membrane protein insertase
MIGDIWTTFLYQPLVNGLIFFYQLLGQNLGWAIIALTAALRLALLPLTLPSLRASQKLKDLQPQLEKLKKKFKQDKQGLAQAQMELYRQHGANPVAGCLPWIIQIIVLIALFRAFNQVLVANGETITQLNELLYAPLRLPSGTQINTQFAYLNLSKPDLFSLPFQIQLGPIQVSQVPGVFLLAAAATQFVSSKLLLPQAQAAQKQAKKTPQKEDDVAAAMQQQMLYLMPVMTIIIGFSFPSGLVLYWLSLSLVMTAQQLFLRRLPVSDKKEKP